MFIGCFEISTSVIEKHVQSIGIIRAFCLPGKTYSDFQCLGGQKKLLGCGLLEGGGGVVSTQADTMQWFQL